jgi:hypothetical protein
VSGFEITLGAKFVFFFFAAVVWEKAQIGKNNNRIRDNFIIALIEQEILIYSIKDKYK